MSEMIHGLTRPQLFVVLLNALFLVWVFARLVQDMVRKSQRPKELARIAAHFGMEADPDEDPLRSIKGRVEGYLVTVTWNAPAKIRVELQRPPGCEVSTVHFPGRPPAGMVSFSFQDLRLQEVFKRRFASPTMASWLIAQGQAESALGRFVRRWGKQVRERAMDPNCFLTIEERGVLCALKRGSRRKPNRFPHFVLFADARDLIPDLIQIARSLDTEAPIENRPHRGAIGRPGPENEMVFS